MLDGGEAGTAGGRGRLVLVEAVPADAARHAAALAAAGLDVTTLGAGEDVAGIVGRERPDAVVIDLGIGHADPFAAIAAVSALEPPVAVVATTADGSLNTAIKAVRAGARDCLVKPFRPERLVDVVRRALGPEPSERAALQPGMGQDSFVPRS